MTDNLFVRRSGGLIKTNTKIIIDSLDSVLYVREGLLSKYQIIRTDRSIIYKSALTKTIIQKDNGGYYYKTFFGKGKYRQIDNTIYTISHLRHALLIFPGYQTVT